MKLVLIGKHVFSPVWEENHLDLPLFDRLSEASEKMLIICQGKVEERTTVFHGNVQMHLLPAGKPFGALRFIFGAVHHFLKCRDEKWDVIGASEPVGGIASYILNLLISVRYMAMIQGDLLDLPKDHFSAAKRLLIRGVVSLITSRATTVRAVSGKIKDSLIDLGVSKDKVEVFRNRVDLNRFNSSTLTNKRDSKLADQGWFGKRVLVFAGALTEEKGFLEFVSAAKLLLAGHQDVVCLIIGDGCLFSRGQEELGEFGGRVKFAGFIKHSEIHEWLSMGDILIFSSHHEGMPRVVLEYMAMGKPVISTPVGGISEVIEHNVNGLLFPVGDVDRLVSYVRGIIAGEIDAVSLAENARTTVENNHDQLKTIEDQVDAYLQIAEMNRTESYGRTQN